MMFVGIFLGLAASMMNGGNSHEWSSLGTANTFVTSNQFTDGTNYFVDQSTGLETTQDF